MRSTLIPLAVILSSIFFISCQREVNERLTDITSGDTVKIKSVVFLDTTITGSNDTSEVDYFFYDSQGRVQHGLGRTIMDPVLNTWQNFFDDYYYNGSATHPFKIASYDDQNFIYDTSYFTYDADGFLVKDSTVEVDNAAGYTGYSVGTYQSAAGGGYVYLYKLNNNSSGFVTTDSTKYHTTYTNSNLINEVDSVYDSGHNLVTVNYNTYSYDSQKNPFSFLNFLQVPGGSDLFDAGTETSFYKNNRQHFQTYYTDVTTGSTSTPQTESITYTYRQDGYPLTGIASGNRPDFNKVIYTYY
jgi:hypothetical protein